MFASVTIGDLCSTQRESPLPYAWRTLSRLPSNPLGQTTGTPKLGCSGFAWGFLPCLARPRMLLWAKYPLRYPRLGPHLEDGGTVVQGPVLARTRQSPGAHRASDPSICSEPAPFSTDSHLSTTSSPGINTRSYTHSFPYCVPPDETVSLRLSGLLRIRSVRRTVG